MLFCPSSAVAWRRWTRFADSSCGATRWWSVTRYEEGQYGCPLGSIANEIADHDEDTRRIIANHFDEWLQMIIDAIDRLRANGVLTQDADPRALASGLLAALQGGYLLAKTARDVNLMRVAVDMAIAQIRAFSAESDTQG